MCSPYTGSQYRADTGKVWVWFSMGKVQGSQYRAGTGKVRANAQYGQGTGQPIYRARTG